MGLFDNYIQKYVDKNMEYLIEEWQLTVKGDIADFKARVEALEKEVTPLTEFEKHASEKLTELENRLKKIKEGLL